MRCKVYAALWSMFAGLLITFFIVGAFVYPALFPYVIAVLFFPAFCAHFVYWYVRNKCDM